MRVCDMEVETNKAPMPSRDRGREGAVHKARECSKPIGYE